MTDVVMRVEGLAKTFRHGFFRKRVEALKGVSFEVARGTIFGFLGPNGAGKTTTIKILTGLIAPTEGRAFVMGKQVPSPEAMREVGFLPENPYVYPYLTPREFVHMCGHLSGIGGRTLRKRAEHELERTGVLYAADRPVRRLSKGMLQRSCLAAALIAQPQLLILDEPMSGLDPVGRKEVRDIILEERDKGRTVFFSSHILSDVESMCDQVTILRRGEVVVEGRLQDLLQGQAIQTDIVLVGEQQRCAQLAGELAAHEQVNKASAVAGLLRVTVQGDQHVGEVLQQAMAAGVRVAEVTPRRETLEDLFVSRAFGSEV